MQALIASTSCGSSSKFPACDTSMLKGGEAVFLLNAVIMRAIAIVTGYEITTKNFLHGADKRRPASEICDKVLVFVAKSVRA